MYSQVDRKHSVHSFSKIKRKVIYFHNTDKLLSIFILLTSSAKVVHLVPKELSAKNPQIFDVYVFWKGFQGDLFVTFVLISIKFQ